MTSYSLIQAGTSRGFDTNDPLVAGAVQGGAGLIILGVDAGPALAKLGSTEALEFVAIELGLECLGVHTADALQTGPSNIVGFARFRLGKAAPTPLVELVRQENTRAASVVAARATFHAAGLVTVVCNDFPGRIVDRLVRPFYNAVLRRLDEGLASAADLDRTLCLGLGYPEGPVALLQRSGLARHAEATAALYAELGDTAFMPARRARIALQRSASTSASM